MATFRGRWTATVDQEFQIEADNEDQARRILDEMMSPPEVVELLDFEVHDFQEVGDAGF